MVSKQSLKPFFSIITCTRNSAQFLKECLDSVETQTFKDYELIIIDGQSSDATKQIITDYKYKFHNFPPHGISDAMNKGISLAKGQYLYFLHSDDQFVDKDVLTKVHDYLVKDPELDWVYGQIIETYKLGNKIGVFPIRKIFQEKNPLLLFFYNYIPHQGVFMKKSVFDKYGNFDEKLKVCMDYDYWLRVGKNTRWSYMPHIVAKYRVHREAVSANSSNYWATQLEKILLRSRHLFKIQ